MKLLVGLLKPTTGDIYFDRFNIKTEFEEYIQNFGAIIEYPSFYDNMTGGECLKYYAKLRNVKGKGFNELFSIVGLNNNSNKKVKFYSLGMKQRLGIAQAILNNPKILILDEPFNGLDPNGLEQLKDFLLKSKENGMSIIISSHSLLEIETLCDRVIFMKFGQIIKDEYIKKNTDNLRMLVETSNNIFAIKLIETQFLNIKITIIENKFYIDGSTIKEFTDILIILKNNHIDVVKIKDITGNLYEKFTEVMEDDDA